MPAQSYNGTYVPANWAGGGNRRRSKTPAVIAGWRCPAGTDWAVQPRADVAVHNGPGGLRDLRTTRPTESGKDCTDDARFLPAVPHRADRIHHCGAGGRRAPGRRRTAARAGDRDGVVCRGDGPRGRPYPLPPVLFLPWPGCWAWGNCGFTGRSAPCPRGRPRPFGRGWSVIRVIQAIRRPPFPGDARPFHGGFAAGMGGAMFAAHAVATLGTALLLARSERALSALVSWLRPLVQLPQPSAATPLRVPGPCAVNLVLPKARAGLRLPTRRGPPELSPAA